MILNSRASSAEPGTCKLYHARYIMEVKTPMATFDAGPVPGFEDDLLNELRTLPIDCAHGIYSMLDQLAEAEPSIQERCGRIADRYELYAVSIFDCPRRRLVVTIDENRKGRPRAAHGSVPAGAHACNTGLQLASRQLGLINPSWEPA